MTEIQKAATRLSELCALVPQMLEQFSEEQFTALPSPGKWSKKQVLGHIVDSAANNHQRFVRIQYEDRPTIRYDQNQWVNLQHYQTKNNKELILLWQLYNMHLVHIMNNISPENLERKGQTEPGNQQSLAWYITDYVAHLEHHLKQIFGERFTPTTSWQQHP